MYTIYLSNPTAIMSKSTLDTNLQSMKYILFVIDSAVFISIFWMKSDMHFACLWWLQEMVVKVDCKPPIIKQKNCLS